MHIVAKTIASILLISGLAACEKQPSEMQKAQIEQQVLGCITAVTTQVGAEESDVFSSLTSLASKVGSASDMSNPTWKLKGGTPEIVNVSLKLGGIKYSCDYAQSADSPDYQLIEARRNNEVVFNLVDDEKAKDENERIKELERVENIKEWTEHSYSNVSYKYYEKRHVADSLNNYGSTKVKIVCNPEGVNFEFDRNSYTGSRNHPFSFLIDGQKVEKKFDITSYGKIGKYDEDNWGDKIGNDKKKQAEFMALLVKSEAIFLDGFEFRLDDLSQIPCLK